jgi:hypothetical protein
MTRYSKVRILFFLLTFRLLVGFVVADGAPTPSCHCILGNLSENLSRSLWLVRC